MPSKSSQWNARNRKQNSMMIMLCLTLDTDIVIPIMGPTGVGKSTFINTLLGRNVMRVGHDITSCTSKLEYAIVDNPPPHTGLHGRVVVVDTPGFDNTYEKDVEIFYGDGMKLGGVIYLQSIAEKRMKGTTRRNLEMFRRLCGGDALSKVVLGTTNWGEVEKDVGQRRERQLAEGFWKDLEGSTMLRFYQTPESAQGFLDVIRQHPYRFDPANQDGPIMSTMRSPPVVILLMGEIGAGKSSFINTAAGVDLAKVGHELEPCTTIVQHFSVQHPSCQREVYFVDTPGFNHPSKDDGVILSEIVDWLRSHPNVQFGGIIYLYDLPQSQEVANEKTIMRLKEPEPRRRVVLAVWGKEGSHPESRLKDITGEQVQIQRFTHSKTCAWKIVDTILAMGSIQVGTVHGELARICNQLPKKVPKKGKKRFLLFKLLGFTV